MHEFHLVATHKVKTNLDDKIFAFVKYNEEDAVFVILNLSSEKIEVLPVFDGIAHVMEGPFINVYDKVEMNISEIKNIELQAWDYRVFEKKKPLKI